MKRGRRGDRGTGTMAKPLGNRQPLHPPRTSFSTLRGTTRLRASLPVAGIEDSFSASGRNHFCPRLNEPEPR